jgi:hypothetical protein
LDKSLDRDVRSLIKKRHGTTFQVPTVVPKHVAVVQQESDGSASGRVGVILAGVTVLQHVVQADCMHQPMIRKTAFLRQHAPVSRVSFPKLA